MAAPFTGFAMNITKIFQCHEKLAMLVFIATFRIFSLFSALSAVETGEKASRCDPVAVFLVI
jgi:hypothetical protein